MRLTQNFLKKHTPKLHFFEKTRKNGKNRRKNAHFYKKIFFNLLTNGFEYVIIMSYKRYCNDFLGNQIDFVPAMPIFKGLSFGKIIFFYFFEGSEK